MTAVLGTPVEIVIWFGIAVAMSILLPLYFGLKFDWDPATIEVTTEEYETDVEEGAGP